MEVWEWSGNIWTKISCAGSLQVNRSKYAMGYDFVQKRTLIFGGITDDENPVDDFLSWDGKKWEKIKCDILPAPRNSAHFVSTPHGLLLYGGTIRKTGGGYVVSNELWSWGNQQWKKIN